MSKRKIIGFCILVALLVVALGVSVSSYAYLRIQTSQINSNVVKTLDCLSISITGSNDINLTNAYAISDTEGKATTPYTFTVKNNCTTSVSATIKLEAQSDSTIDNKYIKYTFNESSSGTGMSYILGSSSKTLATNVTLGNKASKTYALRLWIDKDATYDKAGNGRKYSGKIKIEAVPNN